MTLNGQVLLADDHLAVTFDYEAEAVAEIKQIPGAKWDRLGRVWRVPVTSLDAVRDFAAELDFWISPDVSTLDLPPSPDLDHGGVRFDDEWIWLGFAYDQVIVTSVKQIPGITWDSKTKAWRSPMTSAEEALDFCRRFDLSVPPELLSHADEVAERTAALIHASRATDADIEVAGLPLLGYQRAGVQYALDARRCFIADDMGLGKTIQSIATVEAAGAYPVAVICPPSLVLNWKAEYAKWLPDKNVAVVTDRKSFPDKGTYDVVVLGWSNITHWAEQVKGHQALIADESHYAKSYDAKRTKAVVKVAKTVPADGLVLALTGTPVTNKPAEYAAQLEMLGRLQEFGGKMGFYRRYCNAFRDKWGHWHLEGNSNLDELNEKLRATCFPEGTVVITEVGELPIDYLVRSKYSGRVLGWTEGHGWEWCNVVGWSERDTDQLITIHHERGSLTCTPDHRMYVVGRGWTAADKLTSESVLCFMRRPSLHFNHDSLPGLLDSDPPPQSNQAVRDVRVGLRDSQPTSAILREDVCQKSSTGGAHLSVVQAGVPDYPNSAGLLLPEVLEYGALPQRRPGSLDTWTLPASGRTASKSAYSPTEETGHIPSRESSTANPVHDDGVVTGTDGMARLLRREILVRRSGGPEESSGNRSGRIVASAEEPTEVGSRQGLSTWTSRVDRLEVHQRRGRSRSDSGDGNDSPLVPVFDIEVEGAHSFIADGILVHNCYVRRVKEQVLLDLPPVVHAPMVISGAAGAMTEYRKAEANIVEWLVERAAQIAEELGVSVKSAKVRARMAAESNEHLVKMSVLRRLAARAKMDAVTEWVEQVVGEDRKVVIAAHHREIVDELSHKFGGLKIQGGQDVADVEVHKARFMSEPCSTAPVIVLSIQAAKTGHTLTSAQDVLFVELPWNWADVEQTYSRCHRLGQKGSVTATYMLAAGTVDEEIYAMVQRKRSVVAAATDGGEVERIEMASVLVDRYLQLGLEKLD